MDVRFAPLSIPFERRMQTFAVFFYMSMFLFLPTTTMAVGYILLFHTTYFRSSYWMLAHWDENILNCGEILNNL